MALPAARLKAIVDALTNTDASPAVVNKFGVVKARHYGVLDAYNTAATANEKALVVLRPMIREERERWRKAERHAAQTAADAAIDDELNATLPAEAEPGAQP